MQQLNDQIYILLHFNHFKALMTMIINLEKLPVYYYTILTDMSCTAYVNYWRVLNSKDPEIHLVMQQKV